MKILKFKGKMPLRNKIIIAFIILIAIAIGTIIVLYSTNEDIRNWINVNVLGKEVTEEDVATIKIDSDKSQFIFALDKYIGILCNGKLDFYNSYGSNIHELDIAISNPVLSTSGEYVAIAEKNGQKAYLVSER